MTQTEAQNLLPQTILQHNHRRTPAGTPATVIVQLPATTKTGSFILPVKQGSHRFNLTAQTITEWSIKHANCGERSGVERP